MRSIRIARRARRSAVLNLYETGVASAAPVSVCLSAAGDEVEGLADMRFDDSERGTSGEAFAPEVFAGSSAAAERLRLQVARFAPHFRTVLLVGEPGVGKESVARELHRMCPAGAEPLCALDIEDFAGGADGAGMLYLRGLGGLRTELHETLLRRLNGLGRDRRVVVACAGEPRGMVAAGRLQSEVLERVGMLEIRVAPLRERVSDLRQMALTMLGGLAVRRRASSWIGSGCWRYGWPGNLAELWQAMHGFAADGVLAVCAARGSAVQVRCELEEVIERHVMEVLERCAGNKLRAAELLGISRSTLYRMLGAAG